MLAEQLIVVYADLGGEIQVGVIGADREAASCCYRLEQAELDRWAMGVHKWHGHQNDRPRGVTLQGCHTHHVAHSRYYQAFPAGKFAVRLLTLRRGFMGTWRVCGSYGRNAAE